MIKNILIFACVLSMMVPVSALSASIVKEAEDYTSYQDIALELIRPVANAGCGGGYLLFGLDYPDEWTEYSLSASDFGTYMVQMKCRGEYNQAYLLRLILEADLSGDTQSIDIDFTGRGYSG